MYPLKENTGRIAFGGPQCGPEFSRCKYAYQYSSNECCASSLSASEIEAVKTSETCPVKDIKSWNGDCVRHFHRPALADGSIINIPAGKGWARTANFTEEYYDSADVRIQIWVPKTVPDVQFHKGLHFGHIDQDHPASVTLRYDHSLGIIPELVKVTTKPVFQTPDRWHDFVYDEFKVILGKDKFECTRQNYRNLNGYDKKAMCESMA